MKLLQKIKGTLTAIFFCVLTIIALLDYLFSVIFNALSDTTIISLVKSYLANQNATNKCENEIIWVCAIYIVISCIISAFFYLLQYNKNVNLPLFFVFLCLQFYILQVPFFIQMVGTHYNCESDGQTIMAVFSSSKIVSLVMIPFGIIYDIVSFKKLNNR
jgi:hypothetical protein